MNINVLLAGVEDFGAVIENKFTALKFGGTMLLIGISAVFLVLIIIWAALAMFKYAAGNAGAKESNAPIPVAKTEEAPVFIPQSEDEEIVAVIAAAIAMAESESNGMKFRVVSFRRR